MLIQKLRLQRGWSQQQLADFSGLSVRTIQRIEQGQTPSHESLKSLAAVFETDFANLKEHTMDTHTPSPDENEERLAFKHVRKIKRFYIHLAQYLVIVPCLFAINFLQPHVHYVWAIWPALGWGIGLMFHAAQVFQFHLFDAAWEKRQVEKHLGRKL